MWQIRIIKRERSDFSWPCLLWSLYWLWHPYPIPQSMGRASKKAKVMLGKKTWRRKCYVVKHASSPAGQGISLGVFCIPNMSCDCSWLCFPSSSFCYCFLLGQVLLISGQVYVQGNPDVWHIWRHGWGSQEEGGGLLFFSATGLWPPEPKWNCGERFHGKLWESITKYD